VVTIAAVLIPWLISRSNAKAKRKRETREREAEKTREDTEHTGRLRDDLKDRADSRRRQRDAAGEWDPE
jgi:hypothetical protein